MFKKILAVAAIHKHDTLILGAWGCGVFGNDPYMVAKLFKRHIDSDHFHGLFRHIIFAVLDPSKKHDNTIAFEQTFGRTCDICT